MMPKQKLFDQESDEEVTFKTETEYAKKYDKWREKEEIHKLEQKYGPKALSSDASDSSDSEDDSDEPPEVSEETETQFLKTLALLKTKDPRIYDPGYQFFDDKKEKEQEKVPTSKTVTFEDSDEDDDGDGNIFTIEKKAEINVEKVHQGTDKASTSKKAGKEGKLKEYLTGKVEHIDEEVDPALAPLRALWSDPKLSEGEAFLRDYILNQRYLDEVEGGEGGGRLRDDEALEEDERRVEEQGQFERAYNFRFEEPDAEYLKRFPRTMNYVRPKDERRSKKRAELRARKDEEKRRKMDEIGRLKALKLKEIHEKIARIKEVTGNEDLAFKEEDIEGDFDPREHDRRMRALFDEEYYGGAEHQKPVFPELDEELEIENWDNYEPDRERDASRAMSPRADVDGPHCEDDDFNMDADYDPKQARANLLEEIKSNLGKKRRNRKKKSKLAALLSTEKPKFVPTVADTTYSQYMDEYYKMDCEDVIGGDLPTRFKYREVVPNDFGLSIEEILLADDRELTQWVPLKKMVKHRSADVEKSEVNTYRQKAADKKLKKKILPSLFKDLPEEPELVVPVEEASKKKKKKKKNKKKATEERCIENPEEQNSIETSKQNNETQVRGDREFVHKKEKRKKIEEVNNSNVEENLDTIPKKDKGTEVSESGYEVQSTEIIKKKKNREMLTVESSLKANGFESTEASKEGKRTEIIKKKDKKKKNKEMPAVESSLKTNGIEINEASKEGKRKTKKRRTDGFIVETIENEEPSQGNSQNDSSVNNKKKNRNQFTVESSQTINLKHKLETNDSQIPNKKKKNKNTGSRDKNKKDVKTKFKQKDKFKSKQGKDMSSENPLGHLSDERLKAYGLNPKKYRSFLKYKKF